MSMFQLAGECKSIYKEQCVVQRNAPCLRARVRVQLQANNVPIIVPTSSVVGREHPSHLSSDGRFLTNGDSFGSPNGNSVQLQPQVRMLVPRYISPGFAQRHERHACHMIHQGQK
jgi:hypothetical protein